MSERIPDLYQVSINVNDIDISSVRSTWPKVSYFCIVSTDTGQPPKHSQTVSEQWTPQSFTLLVRVTSTIKFSLARKRSILLSLKDCIFCDTSLEVKPLLKLHNGKLEDVSVELKLLKSTVENNGLGSSSDPSTSSDGSEVGSMTILLKGLNLSDHHKSLLLNGTHLLNGVKKEMAPNSSQENINGISSNQG